MILIIVLIIISTLGVLILNLSEERFVLENYIESQINTEEIIFASKSAEKALKKLLDKDDKSVDYIGELWSQTIPVSLNDINIQIEIIDQERFLNPNFLVNGTTINEKHKLVFERLFDILNINYAILYNIIEWIDKDDLPNNGGKEDYNLYMAKNDKLDTLEELKLIEGINDNIYNGTVEGGYFKPGFRSLFSPYSNGKVNINTASKWILMALDNDIDEALANEIIIYRQRKPFKNIKDLVLVDGFNSDILYRIENMIDVKSENFLAKIDITKGKRKYKMIILLNRQNKTKIVWRKLY